MKHPRGTTREAVYSELRRRILTLAAPPGAPISENEIAADLGVSRTPIREALIRLGGEDLVKVYPQVGTFVALVDLGRVRDAQFMREAVEVAALATLAEAAGPGQGTAPDREPEPASAGTTAHDAGSARDGVTTTSDGKGPALDGIDAGLSNESESASVDPGGAALDQDVLDRLHSNIAAQYESLDDLERFFELDEAFHRDLLALSGHGGLWVPVASAKGHLDRARRLGMTHVRPLSVSADQHAAVLDAVVNGRPGEGVSLLRAHLRGVLEDITRIQEASPELFAEPAPEG